MCVVVFSWYAVENFVSSYVFVKVSFVIDGKSVWFVLFLVSRSPFVIGVRKEGRGKNVCRLVSVGSLVQYV